MISAETVCFVFCYSGMKYFCSHQMLLAAFDEVKGKMSPYCTQIRLRNISLESVL